LLTPFCVNWNFHCLLLEFSPNIFVSRETEMNSRYIPIEKVLKQSVHVSNYLRNTFDIWLFQLVIGRYRQFQYILRLYTIEHRYIEFWQVVTLNSQQWSRNSLPFRSSWVHPRFSCSIFNFLCSVMSAILFLFLSNFSRPLYYLFFQLLLWISF
jgi:hypothetical protein